MAPISLPGPDDIASAIAGEGPNGSLAGPISPLTDPLHRDIRVAFRGREGGPEVPLRVMKLDVDGSTATLALVGEIDMAVGEGIEHAGARAAECGARELVVDL